MNTLDRRSPLAIALVAASARGRRLRRAEHRRTGRLGQELPRKAGPQGRDHPAAQRAPEGAEQRRGPVPARPRVPGERRPGRRRGRAAQGDRPQVSGRCGVAADRAGADRPGRAQEARDRVRQPRDQRPEGARRHPDDGGDRRARAGRHQAGAGRCSSRRSRRIPTFARAHVVRAQLALRGGDIAGGARGARYARSASRRTTRKPA